MDFFDDTLPEPPAARAKPKFQPKVKPQPRKEKQATVSTNLNNAANDTPVATTTVYQDRPHSSSLAQMPDVMSCTTSVTEPLPEFIQNQQPANSTDVLLPDGETNFALLDSSSEHFMDEVYADSRDDLHSEGTIFDTHGDERLGFARSGRETADIFSGLDDILYESTTASAVSTKRRFPPSVKMNAQPENKLPGVEAPIFHASNAKDLEGEPGRSSLSYVDGSTLRPCSFVPSDTSPELVSQETNCRETGVFYYEEDFLIDAERLGTEAFPGLESLNAISQTTTTGDAQSISPEIEYMDDDLHPASVDHDFVDFSTIDVPLPAVPDRPSVFPVSEDSTYHADASGSNAGMPQEVVESQAAPPIPRNESIRSRKKKSSTVLEESVRKVHSRTVEELPHETLDNRPSIATDEGNESGKSSRRLRKRSTAPVRADETEDVTEENVDLLAEPSKYSLVDEDVYNDGDDEYREDTSGCKRTTKKAKPSVQNEKMGRRRKKSSEEPDSLSKEPPKKKFSHSTRRNRRQVNKVLLETPEEEIDPRKLPIKDLILLGELRERRLKQDAVTLKESLPKRSVNNSLYEDAPYDDDDPFASEQADYEAAAPPKHNYHSFMKKRSKKRWSKQDTELFYEAIRQFGTDFTMIEQIFPDDHDLFPDSCDRRRQLVLKFKNEERRHPMKLHDALTNRSKDHSHFELIIEKLQRAGQIEQNSDGDVESVGISGEAEEKSPESNEIANSEQNAEVPNDLEKPAVPEVYGSVKSPQEIVDGDAYKWSPDHDYGDYVDD